MTYILWASTGLTNFAQDIKRSGLICADIELFCGLALTGLSYFVGSHNIYFAHTSTDLSCISRVSTYLSYFVRILTGITYFAQTLIGLTYFSQALKVRATHYPVWSLTLNTLLSFPSSFIFPHTATSSFRTLLFCSLVKKSSSPQNSSLPYPRASPCEISAPVSCVSTSTYTIRNQVLCSKKGLLARDPTTLSESPCTEALRPEAPSATDPSWRRPTRNLGYPESKESKPVRKVDDTWCSSLTWNAKKRMGWLFYSFKWLHE